jgi:hypothetical protein
MMVAVAVVTLVATAIGAYYTWRAFRQARVEARERDGIEITMGGDPLHRTTFGGEVRSSAEDLAKQSDVSVRRAPSMRGELLVAQTPEKDLVPEVARWSLVLFSADDAQRYEIEWNYHLHVLIEEGDPRQARRVQRRLAVRAILLAVEVRARRGFRRRGPR